MKLPLTDPSAEPSPARDEGESNVELWGQVWERENLFTALKRVERNAGAPGIDGKTVADLRTYLKEQWLEIRAALESGAYQPSPVRRVEIPKPDGGVRLLGIPTVIDRLLQQAIAQVLTPIFEPSFSESSFGFRPGRNAHQAIRQVQATVQEGRTIAVDIDLAKFFDTVNHDVLMALLAKTIGDKALLSLIGRYLRAGVLVGEHVEPSEVGTPQGGPLSPLLANILLDQLDRELQRRGHRFARYADDMIILVKSERAAQRVMNSITRYLQDILKLKVNLAKSRVAPMRECGFLGFTVLTKKISWTYKAQANFKHRIKELTGRSWGVSMGYRLHKLGQFLRGWVAYYGISEYYRPVPELDNWIRRRIRMCYWKQWRWARTKIRNLLALGVNPKSAILHGMSSKSYWHMSRTPVVHQALSNAWLRAQGLLSVKDLWQKAQTRASAKAGNTSSSVPTC